MEFLNHAETWIAVAFVLLIALFIYMGVPKKAAELLDERAARIAKELSAAQKLREEAQALLAEYAAKRQEAETEAKNIVEQARRDAEAYGEEARRKLHETIERRTATAQQKIAQAEAQAVKEVRAAVTDLAVSAAERLIKDELKGTAGAKLVDQSIADLKDRLN